MSEFKTFINKSVENINITNSGEALWATMCLIPFLDGQVDETELDIIRTLLPKYLGQMREVGKNPIIDQHYRPFPELNETDWPDLFDFVSHEWDLPERDSEGNITLISIQLAAGDENSALEELFDRVQKSYNEVMNQIIIPIIEKDGTGISERGFGTIPQRATECFQEYVDSFVGIVASFFEGSDERRDFFLAAVMAITFADNDNIGMEQYFLFSIWDAFGFDSAVLTKGDWKERIGIERFHNLDIPTVLPVMSLDPKFNS